MDEYAAEELGEDVCAIAVQLSVVESRMLRARVKSREIRHVYWQDGYRQVKLAAKCSKLVSWVRLVHCIR